MSSTARLKCPFTSLGVAPEAASSYLPSPSWMGGPANLEALTAFTEGHEPDFTALPPGW